MTKKFYSHNHGMDIMTTRRVGAGCRSFLLVATLTMSIGTTAAFANDSYDRNDCNAQAEGKSGEVRRQAIAQCVRKRAQTNNVPPILARISACNDKAGNMVGDARTSFMEACLKSN